MSLVAIFAVDSLVITTLGGVPVLTNAPGPAWGLVLFGALPMANLLAIGLIPLFAASFRRDRKERFAWGFELFGMAALLVYSAWANAAPTQLHEAVWAAASYLVPATGNPVNPVTTLVGLAIVVAPQVAFAWFGGWLVKNYRIKVTFIIERRSSAPVSSPSLGTMGFSAAGFAG
jgi:hypothetical protein